MELHTERTVIRAWRDEEADRLLDIQSRVEVMRWIDDDQEHPALLADRDVALAKIAAYRERSVAGGPIGVWAVEERATGVVAGTVLLVRAGSDPDEEEIEIGWHLHPDRWGHGLAREAGAALLAAGLGAGIPRIHALLYPDNEPSARVCLALGMREQPMLHDTWYPGASRHFLAP